MVVSVKNAEMTMDENTLYCFLKSVPLLSCVADEEILNMAKNGKTTGFKKGDIIFKAGEPSNLFYIVYEGLVAEYLTDDGNGSVILKIKKKQDHLGEMGIIGGKQYFNMAVAMSSLTLIAFSREIFLDIVWNNVCVAKRLTDELVEKLAYSSERRMKYMSLDASGRLAQTLLSLSSEHTEFVIVTQNDLATAAGIARQTAAKIIGKWRDEDIISTHRGCIMIKNKSALLDVATNSNRER